MHENVADDINQQNMNKLKEKAQNAEGNATKVNLTRLQLER